MTWILSDAILQGAKLGPQIFGRLWDPRTNGTCNIGAAFLATGKMSENLPVLTMLRTFPLLDVVVSGSKPCGCPITGLATVLTVLEHLNDKERWTRERSAEWVRLVEEQSRLQEKPPSCLRVGSGRPRRSWPTR